MNPYSETARPDNDLTWRERPDRPCATGNPDDWFPKIIPTDAQAKAACHGCPVINDCLKFALDNDEEWGIWGGTTPEARQRIGRSQPRTDARSRPQARATECHRGHAFDELNTYYDQRGRHGCRTCRNAAKAAHRERMKGVA